MTATSESSDALAAPASAIVMGEEHPANQSLARATIEGSLPTQSSLSVDSLATAYVIVLQSLAETLFEHTAPNNEDVNSKATVRRRLEVCAAVWAANRAALVASTLTGDEQARMQKVVWQRLSLYWQNFRGSPGEISGWVEKRAAEYLEPLERRQPIATANHIVEGLLDAIAIEESVRSTKLRALTSLVSHRIESDAIHLNELKSRYRFV